MNPKKNKKLDEREEVLPLVRVHAWKGNGSAGMESSIFQQGPATGSLLVCSQVLVLPAVPIGSPLSSEVPAAAFSWGMWDGHHLLTDAL